MRILSVGDSWAAGIWDIRGGKHVNTGPGYVKQLNKIAEVDVMWGWNNQEALFNIAKHHHDYDVVLFFVTDPFRDITNPKKHYSFYVNDFLTADELIKANETLLESTIQSANSFEANIKLIGGCHSLKHRNDSNIIIHSVSELVSDGKYNHPRLWDSGWGGMLNFDNCSKDMSRVWLENREQQLKMESEPFQEYFWPDGYHPNAYSNKILGKELVKILTSK